MNTNADADQTDILAQLEKATAQLAALTQERDTLKTENDRLKAEREDFNKRLSAELARHGVRNAEAADKPADTAGRKLTATEKVLAARGVKSLAELAARKTK